VQDVHTRHQALLDQLPAERREDRLCELNVLEQVINVARTVVVQDAWQRGQGLTIHGWIYGLKDGLVRDLGLTVSAPDEIPGRYATALSTLI
jgi:carbonic anhydrase